MMTKQQIADLQRRLNALGYSAGPDDGDFGKRTKAALKEFQAANSLKPDGDYGPLSAAALMSHGAKPAPGSRPPVAKPFPEPRSNAPVWPLQKDVAAFFGPPGNARCTAGKVKLPIPFRIAWDLDKKVGTFSCHDKVEEFMTSIFNEAIAHYGEKEFRNLGLDLFGGCYNLRKMRGGSAYSMHSWGIAVDLDPSRNALEWGAKATKKYPAAEFAKSIYDAFWNIVEDHGAISLGRHANYDWMHFQFARL